MQWGVDLDAGKTGFLNAYEVVLKLNLLNNGTKSTTGDGVWGELVLKTDGDSFVGWKNTAYSDGAFSPTQGMFDGNILGLKAFVDTAKIHFGPAYIGIKSGDTQTGELKMDAAIHSSDDNQAKWLENVGPEDFSQGIVAGFDHDMFSITADVRSYNKLVDVYRVSWVAENAADFTITIDGKTYSNGDLGTYFSTKEAADAFKKKVEDNRKHPDTTTVSVTKDGTYTGVANQYTNAYSFALEGEFKGIENLSVKAGVSYNINDKWYPSAKLDQNNEEIFDKGYDKLDSVLGYSASAGYKLALNDTYYIRPQIGFTGKCKNYNNGYGFWSAVRLGRHWC